MNIKKTLLTFAVATAMTATAQQAPQLRADNIDEVLKAMTLDDKAVLSYCRMSSNFRFSLWKDMNSTPARLPTKP